MKIYLPTINPNDSNYYQLQIAKENDVATVKRTLNGVEVYYTLNYCVSVSEEFSLVKPIYDFTKEIKQELKKMGFETIKIY